MHRKPKWALLYSYFLAVLCAMLAAHLVGLPNAEERVVLTAGLASVPVFVLLWLHSNRLALLQEGAERDDLYEMTTFEYRIPLWTGGNGHPLTIVSHGEVQPAGAEVLERRA
jgi:hypothetical protein